MTDYTIRPATAEDAETIKRMVRSAPLNPNAVDWHYFLVLEVVEEGKPLIASIGMVHPEGRLCEEVDSVMTLPKYRRRGYAEAIVHALIERAAGALYLLAETDLVAYYEKFGFRVLSAEEAPPVMTEEAEWVNNFFGGRTIYHVMGKTD